MKNLVNDRLLFVFLCFALSISPGQARADIVIDDFEVGPFTVSDSVLSGGTDSLEQTGLDANHVIGGRRLTTVGLGDGTVVSADLVVDTTPLTDNGLIFTVASGSRGQLALTYGANSNEPEALEADLTIGGNDRFEVQFAQAPVFGELVLVLRYGIGYQSFSPSISMQGPGVYAVSFDQIREEISGDPTDFTNVDKIRVFVTTESSVSDLLYEISAIRVVPEPVSVSLFMVVTLSLIYRSRPIRTR